MCKAGERSANPIFLFRAFCRPLLRLAPPLNSFNGIAQDVPFRVSAGRFLNIAAVCFKSSGTECLANGLRFFAGNKNFVCHFTHFPCFHLSTLPYSSQMITFLIPFSHSWGFRHVYNAFYSRFAHGDTFLGQLVFDCAIRVFSHEFHQTWVFLRHSQKFT